MTNCNTINCPTCGFEVEETFVSQNCPRCQTFIESKFICGSCHNCSETISNEFVQPKNKTILSKVFSMFTKQK